MAIDRSVLLLGEATDPRARVSIVSSESFSFACRWLPVVESSYGISSACLLIS